jgi:hypothetical protein
MVVAIIALVVAASGTAVAASNLVSGDNLIKKHSLSGNRLRSQTLTGAQINLNKLGTVPSAKNATHATSADAASNATHATSADAASNATHASNADTVGGQLPSAFVPTSHFISSNGLITIAGISSGNKQTIISSGPFTVTLTCTKSSGNVTLSMDASSSEAGSDISGDLEPTAGATSNLELIGPSSTFDAHHNTNIDLAAPSGAVLDFVESVGINSLGSDCWVHFFGFH